MPLPACGTQSCGTSLGSSRTTLNQSCSPSSESAVLPRFLLTTYFRSQPNPLCAAAAIWQVVGGGLGGDDDGVCREVGPGLELRLSSHTASSATTVRLPDLIQGHPPNSAPRPPPPTPPRRLFQRWCRAYYCGAHVSVALTWLPAATPVLEGALRKRKLNHSCAPALPPCPWGLSSKLGEDANRRSRWVATLSPEYIPYLSPDQIPQAPQRTAASFEGADPLTLRCWLRTPGIVPPSCPCGFLWTITAHRQKMATPGLRGCRWSCSN